MRTLISMSVLFIVFGCTAHHEDCETLVAQIRNDHIQWDAAGTGGIGAMNMGEPERRLVALGSRCRRSLIAALDDSSRFVAAHVILTTIAGRHFPGSPSASTHWNHLQVTLYADHVDIPVAQKDKIKRLWTER